MKCPSFAPAVAMIFAASLWGCGGRGTESPSSAPHGSHPDSVAATAATERGEHAGHAPAPDSVAGMVEVSVAPERRQMIGVRTEAIQVRPLARRIRTVGVVTADERLVRKVQTKISGWVEQLFVNFTGQRVRTGDAILSIYSPELVATQQEYLLALRASATRGSGGSLDAASGSGSLLESARSRLRLWDLTPAQIADLQKAGRPHRTVTLHSPIGGYVTLKPVSQGMYVTPEMELYTVTELSNVWVWADIYEDEVRFVAPGQGATIALASDPGRSRAAVVSYVNPTLETATRTLRVRLDVENPDGALKPGMYATVELAMPLGDVLALPDDAVIDTGERAIVFVAINDGRYQPRAVRLGRSAEGYREVLEGLAPGDRVVLSAQFLLDSESRLRAAAGGPAHGGH